MMRGATLLWAMLAIIAGTGLFLLKYEVQAQELRLTALRKNIIDSQEQIHVLKAEWSYLNEPQRLREQAERHLGLHPLKPGQIGTIASLPMADHRLSDPEPTPLENEPVANDQTPLAAPVVAAPPALLRPDEMRKAPGTAATVTPAKPLPPAAKPTPSHQPTKTPPKSMTAQARVAAKPVAAAAKAKPIAVATAKMAPAPKPASTPNYPSYPSYPSPQPSAPTPAVTNTANVMVIKSPALAEPEMASTRARP
jgi:hypothetical protein